MELEREWTFDQAMEAHQMLDAFAVAEAEARTKAEREAAASRASTGRPGRR